MAKKTAPKTTKKTVSSKKVITQKVVTKKEKDYLPLLLIILVITAIFLWLIISFQLSINESAPLPLNATQNQILNTTLTPKTVKN